MVAGVGGETIVNPDKTMQLSVNNKVKIFLKACRWQKERSGIKLWSTVVWVLLH
jgi:predicted PolB exonuclease-like 3'-5' exonuclease